MSPSYHIYPLGDAAITIEFGNRIDAGINREVIARFSEWRQQPFPGMIEAIPAYSSLCIHYDIAGVKQRAGALTAFEWMKKQVEKRLEQPVVVQAMNDRLVRIPVCYEREFGIDLVRLAGAKNLSIDEVIAMHTASTYKVFMLGFLPGFAYMGEVNEKIAAPRKPQPVPIAAGSVGIAGKQTGIYPLASPGGWQIIGRTPFVLFDKDKEEPALLRAGDQVQFYSISKEEFENTVGHGLHRSTRITS